MHRRPLAAAIVGTLLAACACHADPMPAPATRPTTRPAPAIDAAVPSADGTELTFPDAVTIANGDVRLAFSPGAGRVVDFGRAGGPNLLWVAGPDPSPVEGADRLSPGEPRAYYNLGGDKAWMTVQSLWERAFGKQGWPPDGVVDGRAWTVVERGDRRLVCESAESPHLGVVVRRTFALDDAGPVVRITNDLRRVRANVFPLTVWTVTQVRHPEFVLLGTADAPPAAWADDPKSPPDTTPVDGALLWTVPADRAGLAQKTATTGGWVAGSFGDDLGGDVFLQSTAVDPDGSYPDGTNAQSFLFSDYVELELLSPSSHPKPGESLKNRVTWRLIPREGRSARDLLPAIERAVEADRAE